MMLRGRKEDGEAEGAAENDVSLQYTYFTSLTLYQNCHFLKIIPSEIAHVPNHSSCQNSSKPVFTLDFPCFFPIPSATFNFLLYSLSRNPNIFHSFTFSSAPSCALRHSQSLFHSMILSLGIPLQFSSFLYFFLAIVVYFGFPLLGLYPSKFFSLNCFLFSSQASLLSSVYPLETPSLPFSCFTQVIFL